ncbi:MAG TPA: prephenate dehydrogenase/arogenate dehydrogenase family protein [Candidatus Limnocylindrales bacterium]|nr:prephenate dehydrogenase/arogenate dehydrogenase family protein [Candidatus Limnocylindrales bacterium]
MGRLIDRPPRRIAFLGLGLIAGSVARAVAATSPRGARPRLAAWSPSNAGPDAALRDGVIDDAPGRLEDALAGADLVVIGAPPLETVALVERLGDELRPHLDGTAVVTDLASTKAAVVGAADRAGLAFVGGHPMAGREAAGYGHASAELFADRPWVLVPGGGADDAAIGRVEWLVATCGARPVRMDAATHDVAVAAISHLPLVVAAALAEAVAGAGTERPGWSAAAALAATGWRDMTRLARGDTRMGAGIAATNADAIVAGLREVRAVLDSWIEALGRAPGPDADAVEERLRSVRDRLERPPGRG